ncbi:MAG: hypothetical protein OCD02_17395 [Spirochaetaceae bacterium]
MRLLFNILLGLLGFAAIILELFVPTAGLIGIIGVACIILGVVLTFINFGTFAGTIFLLACFIIGPIIIILYFKFFPKSFIGKKLILSKQMKSDDGYVSGDNFDSLLNSIGKTYTNLHPIGQIIIDDKILNATTDGEFIPKDRSIKVTNVKGNKIIVSLKE